MVEVASPRRHQPTTIRERPMLGALDPRGTSRGCRGDRSGCQYTGSACSDGRIGGHARGRRSRSHHPGTADAIQRIKSNMESSVSKPLPAYATDLQWDGVRQRSALCHSRKRTRFDRLTEFTFPWYRALQEERSATRRLGRTHGSRRGRLERLACARTSSGLSEEHTVQCCTAEGSATRTRTQWPLAKGE